jgi:hypothetical protein
LIASRKIAEMFKHCGFVNIDYLVKNNLERNPSKILNIINRDWRKIEQQAGMKLKAEGLDPLYEYYNTGDDGIDAVYATRWMGQTFTVGAVGHTVTSVKLKLARNVDWPPGTVTVSIRETVGGLPTGGDLTVGTTNGDTLPVSPTYEWREIALTEYTLSANTKYAIVIRIAGGTASYKVNWRLDLSSPTYDGGNLTYSTDGGGTWFSVTSEDFMFEVWGNPLAAKPKGTIAIHAKILGII